MLRVGVWVSEMCVKVECSCKVECGWGCLGEVG